MEEVPHAQVPARRLRRGIEQSRRKKIPELAVIRHPEVRAGNTPPTDEAYWASLEGRRPGPLGSDPSRRASRAPQDDGEVQRVAAFWSRQHLLHGGDQIAFRD